MSIHRVTVKVKLLGFIHDTFSGSTLEISVPTSLDGALREIATQNPHFEGALRKAAFVVLVNGTSVQGVDSSRVELSDGDTVTLVPFVAGG